MSLLPTRFTLRYSVTILPDTKRLLLRHGKPLLTLVLFLFSFISLAQVFPDASGIVYVTEDGTADGSSWESATADLQGAINAAGTQKVFVAVGKYDVPSPHSFVMKNNVAIYGGFDPGAGIRDLDDARILPNHGKSAGSILNGKNERPVIWNEKNGLTSSAILDGFTITNGYSSSDGGGIYNRTSIGGGPMYPNFANLVVTGNKADWEGGGIYNNNAPVNIYNSIISDNKARKGGGISSNETSSSLINVLIAGNTATDAQRNGGGIYTNLASTHLINTTVVNNKPNEAYTESGLVIFKNSILCGLATQTYNLPETYGSVYQSLVTNDSPATLFKDPGAGDYRLKSGSVAIDAGSNSLNGTPLDIAGNQRINNGTIDMGAFEYNSSVDVQNIIPDPNGIVYVRKGATGNGTSWGDATGNLQGAINAEGTQKVFVAVGNYDTPPFGNSFALKSNVAVYGGFDPDAGISKLDNIRIFPNAASSSLGTILNGNDNRSVFQNIFTAASPLNHTAILDGFTITGGYTTTNGGGMYNEYASPTLKNLVFRNNRAEFGGGIYNKNSASEMNRIIITDNQVTWDGGGVYNNASSPAMADIEIKNNVANYGGGVFNQNSASPVMVNTLITGNHSGNDAGGMYNDAGSLPVLINSTIAGNTGFAGSEAIYNRDASVLFKNSIVFGGISGADYTAQYSLIEDENVGGNMRVSAGDVSLSDVFADPLAGDYSIKKHSAVVNKGSNALFPGLDANTKDLAGNPRLAGLTIDLGAYENSDGALPVRWISFTVRLNDDHRGVLDWKVDQTNVSGYQIERSSNARDFYSIGTVSGSSEGIALYSFTDPEAAMGTVYYRIRQTDLDGTYSYSRVVSVSGPQVVRLMAYPNPVKSHVNIELGPSYMGSRVSLVNAAGIVLQRIEVKDQILTLDLRRYESGVYLLRLFNGAAIRLIRE